MKKLLLLLPFLACATLYAGSELATQVAERPNRTLCHYYLDKSYTTQDDFSIILVLQGSETASGYQLIDFVDGAWLKKVNAAVLVVEKPGVTRESFDNDLFLRMNTLTQRADDCKMVLDHLRTCEPGWNGKLVTCGISEGATLSAYLSDRIPGIAAAMMLSGGCGMTLREEILVLERKSAAPGFIGFVKKHLACTYINLRMLVAHKFSESIFCPDANTLRWWHVIGDYNPATTLENVSIPLYLAHGSADINTPVESAEALVEHFQRLGKNNLHYHRYEGYDHGYQDAEGKSHWLEVIEDLQDWLESTVLPAVASADDDTH